MYVLDVEAYVRGRFIQHPVKASSFDEEKNTWVVSVQLDVHRTFYFDVRGVQKVSMNQGMTNPMYFLYQ